MTVPAVSARERACHCALALSFAAGAAVGALFVLMGPVPFARMLGVIALVAGLAGCALHLHLTGARPSAVLRAWRARAVASARALVAVAARAAAPPQAALLSPRATSP